MYQRSNVFVKIQKQIVGGRFGGGSGRGVGFGRVRVDVNEELKCLRKFTQKKIGGGGGSGVFELGVFGLGGSGWM